MSESKEAASAPSATSNILKEGYNQTYIIFPQSDADEKHSSNSNATHDVFFRCGNWCYRGPIDFHGVSVSTAELPVLIPTLQRQQSCLRYFCNATRYVM